MKLAEALILRADYQKRLEQLKARLLRSAKVQEGDDPPENPQDLLAEVESVADALAALIQRINKTNSRTEFSAGVTLTDALAVRDVLKVRREVYAALANAAVVTQDRYSKSEVRFRSTVHVAQVQKRADDLSMERRELDARIQEANWLTELVE